MATDPPSQKREREEEEEKEENGEEKEGEEEKEEEKEENGEEKEEGEDEEEEDSGEEEEEEQSDQKKQRKGDGATRIFGDNHAKALAFRMEQGNFQVSDGDTWQHEGTKAKGHYIIIPSRFDAWKDKKKADAFGGRFGRRLTAIGFVSPAKNGLGLPFYTRPKCKPDGSPDELNLDTLEPIDLDREKQKAEDRFADPFA